MKKYYYFFSFLAAILFLFGCGKKEEQTDSPKQSVNIFLVAHAGSSLTGKSIGCNDVLVPVSKEVVIEKSPIYSAVNELISAVDTDELHNYVRGPQLMLVHVTIAGGIAEIFLQGDLIIAGACDIPRIREQLYETVKQFQEIKKFKFYLNERTLESYLNIASKGL